MAADIGRIAQLLDATLDPRQHRQAEAALKEEQKKPQISITLLQLVSSAALPNHTRLAAALCFKNFIRSNYTFLDGTYKLPEDEVAILKQELVGLMIASPPNIQAQLGDAIAIIAESDFPFRWENLMKDLVGRLSETDFKVTSGVLTVAHSIFSNWRHQVATDLLNSEVNHALGHLSGPLMKYLQITDNRIQESSGNTEALKGWFKVLNLLVEILYDLSCIDFPPVIEDNKRKICDTLNTYLSYYNPALVGDDDEGTVLDTVKTDICDVLTLWFQKYADDFGSFEDDKQEQGSKKDDPNNEGYEYLVDTVLALLANTGPEIRHDILVSKALNFVTKAAAAKQRHARRFKENGQLKPVVANVILSNISLRESDIELFEDEPIEFIRRDLEGSDTDSRRKGSIDFLRTLLEKDDGGVTRVILEHIGHCLSQSDWKAKDTGINLYLATAASGAVTAAKGVISINPIVAANENLKVTKFFETYIASDLLNEGVEPIAKVDAIKYLHNFRSQLTADEWGHAIDHLIRLTASPNYVIYTYAAITIERALFLTDGTGRHLFSRDQIESKAIPLLDHLLNLIERDTSPAKMQENEFLMRCIMRVLIFIKDGAAPILDVILTRLIGITNVIKENPSNPRFYHYHFDAIGALVSYCGPAAADRLEAMLWEPFGAILQQEVSEFVPYVFQLLAALIEASPPTREVSANLKNLYKALLLPPIWEARGNAPACGRFISAMIPRTADFIVAEGELEATLGIFQKLLSSKNTHQSAFDVLEAIVASFSASALDPYFDEILRLLFTKLEKSEEPFKRRFTRFYHLASALAVKTPQGANAAHGKEPGYGADFFIRHAESVQAEIFRQLYLGIILKKTSELTSAVHRKLAAISYTHSLCYSEAFAVKYQKGWGLTCDRLLELLINAPTVATGGGDQVAEEDPEEFVFGANYSALSTCNPGFRDYFPDVTNVPQWVGGFMKQSNANLDGRLNEFVATRLSQESQAALAKYVA